MRKFILFLSALLFVGTLSAQELKVAVSEKGKCGYVDQQGNEVVKCKYTLAFPFKDGLGKVGKGDKFGFVDATGKEVLPVKYEEITPWTEGIYRLKSGDKYGLFFVKDNTVLKPQYSVIGKLNQHGKALLTAGGKNKDGRVTGTKIGLIDANGKVLVKPAYEKLYEFGGNRIEGKLSKMEIKIREISAKNVSQINARNKKNGANVTLTPPKPYGILSSDTLSTSCDYVVCYKGSKAAVVDEKGKLVTPFMKNAGFNKPSSGMCMYRLQNKKPTLGYYNIEKKKNLVIAKNMNIKKDMYSGTSFVGNIAAITHINTKNPKDPKNHAPLYFINKEGKKVLDGYSAFTQPKEGYWIVTMLKDMDATTQELMANMQRATVATEQMQGSIETQNNKLGVYSSNTLSLNGKKLYLPSSAAGMTINMGLLDGDGNVVFEMGKYTDIVPRQDGKSFLVANQSRVYGVIDKTENEVLPFEYSQMKELANGWLLGVKGENKKSGIIDTDNNVLVPFEYSSILENEKENITNLWVRKDNAPFYYNFSLESKQIVGDQMNRVTNFSGDYAWVNPVGFFIYPTNVNLLAKLCVVYKANADLKKCELGVLVDKEGKQVTSYPIPQGVFQAMADKVKENGGSLSPMQERSLLYKLIRNEFKYELQSTIPNEEWEF